MNKRTENKATMIEGVRSVLAEHTDEVKSIPAFDPTITKFNDDVIEFKGLSIISKDSNAGKTDAKSIAEDDLIEDLVVVSSALYIIGIRLDRPDLRSLGDTTESKFTYMRDTELVTTGKVVLKAAQDVSAELVSFGISDKEITELKNKIDAFEASIGGSEGGQAAKKSANKSVQLSMKKILLDLDELDKLVLVAKKKCPEFYDEYVAVRPVKATGLRHKPPKAQNPPAGKSN